MSLHPVLALVAVLLAAAPVASAQRFPDARVPVQTGPPGGPQTGSPTSLLAGDVDGDGDADLVVTELGGLSRVLRRDPTGFQGTAIAEASIGAALVDLNGDGRADLLSEKGAFVGYSPGTPAGGLGTFVSIQAKSGSEVFWTKGAADVNGDGNVDVIASLSTDSQGSTGVLRWFAGNGFGVFSNPQSTPSTPYPLTFTLGDFDADGVIDAVSSGSTGGSALLFRGGGSGFLSPVAVATTGAEARFVATGDFDADGIDDLACYPYSTTFTWFRGGPGGLVPGGAHVLPGATSAARDLEAADLDQDGADELLLTEGAPGNGNVWRCAGTSGSGLASPVADVDVACSGLAAAEFDGRPGLDLAYVEVTTRWPTWRPGDGAGGFLPPNDVTVPGACADLDAVAAGDVDGDGALDLVFETGEWRRGVGDGTFHPSAIVGARASRLVDLDGDGRLDAVALVGACGPASGLSVAFNAGGGTFGPISLPPQPPLGSAHDLEVADVDADGDLDLVTAGAGGVFVHPNAGAGVFAAYQVTPLPGPAMSVGVGDLNADGFADVARTRYEVVFGSPDGSLEWALGVGGGGLGSVQSLALAPLETGELAIEDVDDDGREDVVWPWLVGHQVVVAIGDGTGALAPSVALATFQGPGSVRSVAFADVDGDGRRDLIAGGLAADRVSVARGTGGGDYTVWRDFRAGVEAGRILPYDFDADGRLDLAWGSGTTVRIVPSRALDPAGTVAFGAGTFGCAGRASLGAIEPAKVGNGAFRLLAHHLPPHGLGWFLLGTASSVPGIDPFGLGLTMHVDPILSSPLYVLPVAADAAGQADLALPIPNVSQLAGLTLAAQAVHVGAASLGHDCSTSPLSFVGTRGLQFTIQP